MLAIDIGGTKLDVGVVDESGRIVMRERAPTDIADPWPGLATLVDVVLARSRDVGVEPSICGVGCGGPMAPGGAWVSPLNITGWRRFPLRDALTARTGLDTFVDNDAKALALGEGWLGAAAGERDFMAMVVSTGVGGGIVLDGRLLDGDTGNAGHVGHVTVVPGGRPCGCGALGCLEAEASGLALAEITGRPPTEAPAAIVERTGTLVGRAVAAVAVLLDLRLTVVAGSVALGFGEPFFVAAQAELDRSALIEYAHGGRIVAAGLGSDGPLIGAAAVALRHCPTPRPELTGR